MENLELAKALASLPLTVLLVMVLVGGYLGWWIYGSVHRNQVADLERQVAIGNSRADKWESRFLELYAKLDRVENSTRGIQHAVAGTAIVAEEKIASLEGALTALHDEMRRSNRG